MCYSRRRQPQILQYVVLFTTYYAPLGTAYVKHLISVVESSTLKLVLEHTIMHKHRPFFLLVTPSALSAAVTIVLALGILVSALVRTHDTSSALAEGLQGFQLTFAPLYHRLTDVLSHNTLLSNLPLLLFWSVVGAVVYLIAVRLYVAFSDTADLEQTLTYANVRRDSLIETLLLSFGLRLVALFGWLIYCAFLFKTIFPRIIAVGSLGHLAVSLLLVTVAVHIHVIFVRLITLRTRIFSATE